MWGRIKVKRSYLPKSVQCLQKFMKKFEWWKKSNNNQRSVDAIVKLFVPVARIVGSILARGKYLELRENNNETHNNNMLPTQHRIFYTVWRVLFTRKRSITFSLCKTCKYKKIALSCNVCVCCKIFQFEKNLGRGDCSRFPTLLSSKFCKIEMKICFNLLSPLNGFHPDLNQRFEDILHLKFPDWMLNP